MVNDDRRFLLFLVDHVWNTAFEDESVPSTEWANQMIDEAIADFKEVSENG